MNWPVEYIPPAGTFASEEFKSSVKFMLNDPIAINPLTAEELAQYGFFAPFVDEYSALYAPIDEANDLRGEGFTHQAMNELLSKKETTWQLLASGIPALSFATGANRLMVLDSRNDSRNFDMQALRDKNENGIVEWLRALSRPEEYVSDWYHSDLKDQALPYVHNVLDKMISLVKEGKNEDA